MHGRGGEPSRVGKSPPARLWERPSAVSRIGRSPLRAKRIASARNTGGYGRGIETPLQGQDP